MIQIRWREFAAVSDAVPVGTHFDVLIIGGGPVGACAGALLLDATPTRPVPLRVGILEPRPPQPPAADSPLDSRVVALSRASERILRAAGAWDLISGPRIQPYERMRIWHESTAAAEGLTFDAADVGEPNLGFIAENRLLQSALLERFQQLGGQVHRSTLQSLRVDDLHVAVQTPEGTLSARLVIGADGARSAMREAVGLSSQSVDFQQTAVVATIATEKAHQLTAWQRFMRHGTLALLPLADGTCSIVWSADNALAADLLAMSEADFARELNRASDEVLGSTRLVSARQSFLLTRMAADRYVAHRCALIGDAAHVVHPLAGQGVNLGLLDAAALAELVLQACDRAEDPGAIGVLRRYERWRKSEVAVMDTAINAFDRFLAHGAGPLSRIAQRGLGWVNRSQEARRFFIRRALGVSGELPRAAR